MPQCDECPGLVLCGGGCPYEAYQKEGDIWALDKRLCIHCKESIKWMMEELYKGRSADNTEESAVLSKMKEVADHGRFIRRFMPTLREVVDGVTDEELQQGADIFRQRNGLTSAKATAEWMSRHGITLEFFEEFLESNIQLSRAEDRLKKNTAHLEDKSAGPRN